MISKRTIVQLLVLGGCVAAVSVTRADGEQPAASAARGDAAAPVSAVGSNSGDGRSNTATSPARGGDVRVLQSARDPQLDAIPAQLKRSQLLSGGEVDVDFASARRVVGAGGEPAWIARSSDGASICAVRAGALACPSAALLEVTGLSPGINGRAGEPFHVWGIAGDDVSSVVLVEADGSRSAVAVTDNFFDVETDDWPRQLTWTGPSGAESFTFPAYP